MRRIDITNKRFGKLVVLRMAGKDKNGNGCLMWECLCDCGTKKIINGSILRRGNAKSCGCGMFTDLLGKRFHRLVVIGKTDKRASGGSIKWLCKCDCGNTKVIASSSLVTGLTQSCGCARVDSNRKISAKRRIGNSAEHSRYNGTKLSAKRRKLSFDIPYDVFLEKIHGDCVYCGQPPRLIDMRNSPSCCLTWDGAAAYMNGLDRVDNNKGYTVDNVVSCCSDCNRAKWQLSYDDFLALCQRVVAYSLSKRWPSLKVVA